MVVVLLRVQRRGKALASTRVLTDSESAALEQVNAFLISPAPAIPFLFS